MIGTAATIQFQPGATGLIPGGLEYPAVIAGQPKQTAIPNHPVSVGVANILTVFVGAQVPSFHHADFGPHFGHGTNQRGEAGQTAGTQIGGVVPVAGICIQVREEKIGNHSSTLSPSPIGFPNNTGSLHGARGAQLSGVAIHHPQPNPQPNHSII